MLLDLLLTAESFRVSDLRDPSLWHDFGFLPHDTASGMAIGPETALQLSAYFGGIRLISEDVAKLPFPTYHRLPEGGRELAAGHPITPLLNLSPNENMTSMALRESMTAHALGWGNGFAVIQRDRKNTPTELFMVHPSRVQIKLDRLTKRIFYSVRLDDGSVQNIAQFDMFHLHGLSPDGIRGYSVAHVGAESLGRAFAAQEFSATFFRSGSSPKGVLQTDKIFEEDGKDIERLRAQFASRYAGPEGWHKPLVLDGGMTWKSVSINPKDAQLLMTERFGVEEIARWLRIAPHKLGHLERATFSNIEEQNIDHVTDTLLPWMVRWEKEAQRKLFLDDREFFAEHLVQALLRGNQAQRAEFYRNMLNIGAMTQNEIRRRENLNPVEGGDTTFLSSNLVRSEDVVAGRTGATGPAQGRVDGSDNAPQQRDAHRNLMLAVVGRLQTRERKGLDFARKKHTDAEAYTAWGDTFYQKQLECMVRDLAPVADATAAMACAPPLSESTLRSYALTYIASVRKSQAPGESETLVHCGEVLVDSLLDRIFHLEGRYNVRNHN